MRASSPGHAPTRGLPAVSPAIRHFRGHAGTSDAPLWCRGRFSRSLWQQVRDGRSALKAAQRILYRIEIAWVADQCAHSRQSNRGRDSCAEGLISNERPASCRRPVFWPYHRQTGTFDGREPACPAINGSLLLDLMYEPGARGQPVPSDIGAAVGRGVPRRRRRGRELSCG
jgi:hypothetical protein